MGPQGDGGFIEKYSRTCHGHEPSSLRPKNVCCPYTTVELAFFFFFSFFFSPLFLSYKFVSNRRSEIEIKSVLSQSQTQKILAKLNDNEKALKNVYARLSDKRKSSSKSSKASSSSNIGSNDSVFDLDVELAKTKVYRRATSSSKCYSDCLKCSSGHGSSSHTKHEPTRSGSRRSSSRKRTHSVEASSRRSEKNNKGEETVRAASRHSKSKPSSSRPSSSETLVGSSARRIPSHRFEYEDASSRVPTHPRTPTRTRSQLFEVENDLSRTNRPEARWFAKLNICNNYEFLIGCGRRDDVPNRHTYLNACPSLSIYSSGDRRRHSSTMSFHQSSSSTAPQQPQNTVPRYESFDPRIFRLDWWKDCEFPLPTAHRGRSSWFGTSSRSPRHQRYAWHKSFPPLPRNDEAVHRLFQIFIAKREREEAHPATDYQKRRIFSYSPELKWYIIHETRMKERAAAEGEAGHDSLIPPSGPLPPPFPLLNDYRTVDRLFYEKMALWDWYGLPPGKCTELAGYPTLEKWLILHYT